MVRVQDQAEWRAEQARTIGGSTAAAAVGKSKYLTPVQLWEQMTGRAAPPDLSDNPDVRRGIIFEPLARELLSEKLQMQVRAHPQGTFVYNKDWPWAHSLPDFWAGGMAGEIKCPRPATISRIVLNGLPDAWWIQAIHTLAVTATRVMHYAVFDCVNAEVLHFPVEWRDPDVEWLGINERHFYGFVQRDESPPDVLATATDEMPEKPHTGKLVEVDDEISKRLATHYLRCRDLAEEALAVKANAADRLRELVTQSGGAVQVAAIIRAYATIQNGRRTFDHKRFLTQHPEFDTAEWFKVGDPFDTFRVYALKAHQGDEA